MKLPPYSELVKQWLLYPETVFLNHGSFGACPVPVLNRQWKLRQEMERDPVQFMVNDIEELLWSSKEMLSAFAGCRAKDLLFVPNATTGVNTVLHNLRLKEGDEILTHNMAYGACWNALCAYAEKWKAKLVTVTIPFPLSSPDEIITAFKNSITPRTRLAMIDHVTSMSGLLFPVKEITRELQERGVEVLIDGAHAPGMVELNLGDLNPEYYTGNCHKWICSPKGSALLYVREDKQKNFNPLVISHVYDKPAGERTWSSKFFWPGTNDYTAIACVGTSIDFMGSLFGDWNSLRRHNHHLVVEGRRILLEALGTDAPCPADMLGSLATVPLPFAATVPPYNFNFRHPVGEILHRTYKIQVPVFTWPQTTPRLWLRISAQAYNSIEQIKYLGDCLREMIKENKP